MAWSEGKNVFSNWNEDKHFLMLLFGCENVTD